MPPQLSGPLAGLVDRRISRRAFLRFCVATTTLLALPTTYASHVAAAVASAPRIPLVWLRGEGCGGNSEAFMRAANPGIAELLLDSLSVDYLETIMAPAGAAAEAARTTTMARFPAGYIAVVEGAISTADDGVYHTVGGRPFRDVVRDVCDGALATIAVGSCAFDGGLARASGGNTDAAGVDQIVANPRFVALPGCPVNVANLAATLVHFLTFNALPAADSRGRPLFAYGSLLHNLCERRPHFEFGEFVREWGDEGAQKGWCLYKMGCKGPQTFSNCATTRYDEGTSWPVQAGHGCIGCHMPGFWDSMGPAYSRLPGWLPFNPDVTVDAAGMTVVGGVAALAAAHGAASIARARRHAASRRRTASVEADGTVTQVEAPVERAVEPATPPLEQPVEAAPEPAPTPEPEALATEEAPSTEPGPVETVEPAAPADPVVGEG
jgi:hydrogenase (NiFe) small subunit (hydA)